MAPSKPWDIQEAWKTNKEEKPKKVFGSDLLRHEHFSERSHALKDSRD